MHHRNIRTLATKTYKVQLGIFPPLFNRFFVERDCNYNLRRSYFVNKRRVNSGRYDTESVSYLSPKIQDILPKEIQDSETLYTFQSKNKKTGSMSLQAF